MGCIYKTSGLYSRMTVGAVLLAAGAGSRLGGRPKALLELGGVPLVMRQLIALSGAGVDEVAIVLGHHAEAVEAAVREFPITLVRNPSPDDGQASSVRIGLQALSPKLDAVIVALADQPLINEQDITALIGAFKKRGDAAMVVPRVTVAGGDPLPGNPVIFDAALREEWLSGAADLACRKWRHGKSRARALVRYRQPPVPRRHRYAAGYSALRREHRSHADMAAGVRAGRGCMTRLAGAALLRLTLARACAWGLLVAGWVGIGSFALQFAPSVSWGFALIALWLVALGAAAKVATRGGMRSWTRALALCAAVVGTDFGLWWSVHGGGLGAVLLALAGWAALTALASGVVRSLRLAQSAVPAPPVAAAALGALCAGLALGDLGDLPALANRLATFVVGTGALLVLLQSRIDEGPRAPGCRAGLFDCSLPAWPAGAWRDPGNGRCSSPDWPCCR